MVIDVTELDRLDDAALLSRAADDPGGAAFRVLYERHAGPVFRFLLGLTHDRGLAEDLLQESFFRVHQHLDRIDPARELRPWLFQVARNAALNQLRARKKLIEAGERESRPGSDRVPALAAKDEQVASTREALERLDDEERALLLQRHGLGLKLEELAASWGCTERTIRNRLHAASASLLRAMVGTRNEGGRA